MDKIEQAREALAPCPLCGLEPEHNMHFVWCSGPEDEPHQLVQMAYDRWNCRAPYADQFEADLAGAMIEAAEVASHNRVELGFIRMPYAPDPAHDALPIIRAAISDLESSPLCDCERGHNGLGVVGRECDCMPTTHVEQEPVGEEGK